MSQNFHGKFRGAFINRSLNEVSENAASFQAFNEQPYMIGTQGIRGCFVVVIGSRLGAILSHIGPANVDSVMGKVKDLYNTKRVAYLQDARVWIVRPSVPDASSSTNVALDRTRVTIATKLREMGISKLGGAGYSFHSKSDGNSPEFPDKGTVVAGKVGNRIEVWVENRLLHWW